MNPKKLQILEKNFELYWSGQEPEISDERFDQLMEELRVEDPNHPFLSKLGLNVKRGQQYIHETPMLSLNKVYSFNDLKSWISKVSRTSKERFVIQYKFDGLAGKLIDQTLATRGNGKIGENISRQRANIDLVQGHTRTPVYKINHTEDPILGEIVVTMVNFSKYKNVLGQDYAHPRNFVAGAINRKEPLPGYIKLDFVEYKTSPCVVLNADEFTEEKWAETVSEFNEQKLYPTDGLVIKLFDESYGKTLGFTEHHPLSAIAFKFYGKTAWTKLLDIEWSHGKGCLTPVAIVEPVEIGGVTISRVTMHNAKFVKIKDIKIGDTLEIERAGEVIPHVLNRKPGDVRKESIPNKCPTCGEKTVYEDPEIKCPNPDCPGTRFEQFYRSLECFEIDGLGQTVVQHLFKLGLIHSPAGIFRLSYNEALRIPGFADGLATKLIQNIEKKRKQTPEAILASLNTPGVGKSMYSKILEKIDFEKLISNTTLDELAVLPNIGRNRALAIKRSLHRNQKYLADILNEVELVKPVKQTGKKICFTGKMPKPRSYYENLARQTGYAPVSSVTKDLDFLIVSSKEWKSDKTKTAEKFGIKIKTLEDWENGN